MKKTLNQTVGVTAALAALFCSAALADQPEDSNREARHEAIHYLGIFHAADTYFGKTPDGEACRLHVSDNGRHESSYAADLTVKPARGKLRRLYFYLPHDLGDDEYMESDVVGKVSVLENRIQRQTQATARMTPVDDDRVRGKTQNVTVAYNSINGFAGLTQSASMSTQGKTVHCGNLVQVRRPSAATARKIERLRTSEIPAAAVLAQIVEAIRADAQLSQLPTAQHEPLAQALISIENQEHNVYWVVENFQF